MFENGGSMNPITTFLINCFKNKAKQTQRPRVDQTVSQKWSQCSRHLKQCCGIFTAVLSKRGRFFLVAPSLKKFMVPLQRAKDFYDQRFISASIF